MAKLYIIAIVLLVAAITAEADNDVGEKLITEVLTAPPKDCARKAAKDDIVQLHYVGKLTNGTVFDDSRTHTPKEAFEFKLGHDQVIEAWDQGIVGMCVGEKRKLTVPPSLGYGKDGYHDQIPANATLIFDIEVVAIKDDDGSFSDGLDTHGDHSHVYGHDFDDMDTNSDNQVNKEELTAFLTKLSKDGKEKIDDVDKAADEMIKEHDTNHDGQISFEENQHFGEHHEEEHHDDHHEAHPTAEAHHDEPHHDEAHPEAHHDEAHPEAHAEAHHDAPHAEEHHDTAHADDHHDDHHEDEEDEHEEL